MDHVAVIALTCRKGSVGNWHCTLRRYHIVASSAHSIHVTDQLYRTIRVLRMAGIAGRVGKRRMIILSKQTGALRAVRVMTIGAVRLGQVVSAMLGRQLRIQFIAGTADCRGLVRDE